MSFHILWYYKFANSINQQSKYLCILHWPNVLLCSWFLLQQHLITFTINCKEGFLNVHHVLYAMRAQFYSLYLYQYLRNVNSISHLIKNLTKIWDNNFLYYWKNSFFVIWTHIHTSNKLNHLQGTVNHTLHTPISEM